jgi:hypothetical protein
MPENLFTITTTPPSSLELDVGQVGKLSFTVTSLAAPDQAKDVMLQALLVTAQGKKEVDWLVPGPARTLTIAGGKTETVTITVKPTASSPAGESTIELAIADKDNPNDTYVYSSPVTCEVKARPAVAPAPSSFPRWLIPVIIGGVLVLGGAAFAVWKFVIDKAPALGETCEPADQEACRDNLVCSQDAKKCLLPAGADCSDAALCESGECATGLNVCTRRLGEACDPATAGATPCPGESHCDEATRTCLKNVCKPGEVQCTADGKSLSTCQDNGTFKTEPCPPNASSCRNGKCQCAPDRGKACNCGGIIQCDGSCSAPACASSCVDGKCCVASAGAACGKCGGITRCDGSCSVPTPPNLGGSCGQCGGKVKCDGSCSVQDPPRMGLACGDCGGKIQCNGSCSNTKPLCPPGFIVDPDTRTLCRSTKPALLARQTVGIPATCPLDKDLSISFNCGTNRVQASATVKQVSAGTGLCTGNFATTNPTDCDVRVNMRQMGRPAPFGVCLANKCEITVMTFQRTGQCGK